MQNLINVDTNSHKKNYIIIYNASELRRLSFAEVILKFVCKQRIPFETITRVMNARTVSTRCGEIPYTRVND